MGAARAQTIGIRSDVQPGWLRVGLLLQNAPLTTVEKAVGSLDQLFERKEEFALTEDRTESFKPELPGYDLDHALPGGS